MGTTVAEAPVQAPAPPTRPSFTTAQMVEKYLALRDKKAEIEKAHKTQLSPYNVALAQLEAFILDDLNNMGGDSLKTENGTAYKTTRTSASVKDWPATMDYIKQNAAWDLLEARVSKNAVLAAIEETGAPVPGVNVTQETTLNIRRS